MVLILTVTMVFGGLLLATSAVGASRATRPARSEAEKEPTHE